MSGASAPPETDLGRLLAGMAPRLDPRTFVFVAAPGGWSPPADLAVVMRFSEREGDTLIVTQDAARAAGLDGRFACRMITLDVRSALDAVGFLAAVTQALAARGVPANAVSAFHHDHLFVPVGQVDEAVAALEALANDAA